MVVLIDSSTPPSTGLRAERLLGMTITIEESQIIY